MDKKLAEETSIILLRVSSMLDKQLRKIQSNCTQTEFEQYRKGFGLVLGYSFTDIMRPLYKEHPELQPKQLGGPYEVDPRIYEDNKEKNEEK